MELKMHTQRRNNNPTLTVSSNASEYNHRGPKASTMFKIQDYYPEPHVNQIIQQVAVDPDLSL
ncbi:hypothetical protein ACMD2_01472 [Ananas comosus]|uniref:Uncharacterized protein n=1 Tax=Ananas comosus TaxID=4615 RepID=A0A199VBQ3_ANACO|nr:hypothetical protein ACMD2_01472 [Ananas comosus]